MLAMLARRTVAAVVVSSTLGTAVPVAVAHPGECHVIDVSFQPSSRTDLSPGFNRPPQVVVWLERTNGEYLRTVYITNETGVRGLGNRPGRFDFNSGPLWPYGRRITTFPVWANRHGEEFDLVVFQNGDDSNLSHPFNQSSKDSYFCRPMQRSEPNWDALTCASPNSVYTDKGMLDGGRKSKYPPRSDLQRVPGTDHATVDEFSPNPFDAVSQATPAMDTPTEISWPIPEDLTAGDYVMMVEVAKEFDHNATYSREAYPPPAGISWSEYGEPYRGQPSIVFRVPFTIGTMVTTAQVTDYAGYSDPDGLDATLRSPDDTISTGVPGSGVGRFALLTDDRGSYRVRVVARPEFDASIPAAPMALAVDDISSSRAELTFTAPGDDGMIGKVTGYDIRVRVSDEITEDNFADSPKYTEATVPVGDVGSEQTFSMTRLLPETKYSVGIRAFDDCHNTSALTVLHFTTPQRSLGEVDACFVATAAYGSLLAADVQSLRHLRDAVLRKSVLGELAVQTYYTFSPALAGVISESELLRATARTLIVPVVRFARAFRL